MKSNLYQAEVGKKYTISAIPDHQVLSSIGIFEGAEVKTENRYGIGGPVSLSLSTRKIAIGKDIALKIFVEEVK